MAKCEHGKGKSEKGKERIRVGGRGLGKWEQRLRMKSEKRGKERFDLRAKNEIGREGKEEQEVC